MSRHLDEIKQTRASFSNILPKPVPLDMEILSAICKLVSVSKLDSCSIVVEDGTIDRWFLHDLVKFQHFDKFGDKTLDTQ